MRPSSSDCRQRAGLRSGARRDVRRGSVRGRTARAAERGPVLHGGPGGLAGRQQWQPAAAARAVPGQPTCVRVAAGHAGHIPAAPWCIASPHLLFGHVPGLSNSCNLWRCMVTVDRAVCCKRAGACVAGCACHGLLAKLCVLGAHQAGLASVLPCTRFCAAGHRRRACWPRHCFTLRRSCCAHRHHA